MIDDGLAFYRDMIWVRCKLRKPATCRRTGVALLPGDDAWRPISNGIERMNRIAGDALTSGYGRMKAMDPTKEGSEDHGV